MKIFLAGATGAVGQALIPLLTSHGHTVVGTTRSASKVALLRELGAEPVVVDGLDRDGVRAAVADAQPDAIVHQMTALGGDLDLRKFERSFATTNRLRTEGTDHLLAAARESGVERFVAQSFAAWPYARVGGPVKTEDDPLDQQPPKQVRTTLEAIKHLEAAVTGAGGIALRYGGFYGPGTELRARRRAVGDGQGAQVPGRRRRRRRVLVRPHRRRRERRRSPRWSAARRAASTTSPTTIRRRSASGCRRSPRRSARRRRATSRAGSGA